MANVEGMIPNFGMKETPTIQQRLATLQAQAEYAYKTWHPAIGDVITGEVLAFDNFKLIIKTTDIPFLNVIVYNNDSFQDKNCNDLFVVGDLIALAFNGDNPPRGFKHYGVVTEKKTAR
jgi:hypothetical protein